jgi:nucleoporin p58/p45
MVIIICCLIILIQVESIHQYMESMKSAYLADQRRRGEVNDPFLEADRRETARQEAASKRVHPTLHLPANSQPSTQVAGLFSSSGTQGALTSQQTAATTSSLSTGSGLSLFSTPTSAPSSSSMPSLFTTPTTPAPGNSWFASSSSTPQPQSSIFGSASSSLPGATSTPSLFGNNTPLFNSTPAASSLFSTPFASGTFLGHTFS